MSFEIDANEWVTTPHAAKALGVAPLTLKRWADRDQFLKAGEHFMWGPHHNSARRWRVEAVKAALHARGARGYSTAKPER
jgi:hypothetical protein